ncbi:AmiS/UreI family transporter [uncultured Psychrobacter sp.]|uniref:AmiS/UreI family transporter n=1 Tax=uncultured Psychrobacter sp. TaxID=259303 RepID=UPI002596ED89|nr:AmiS/UreI family transporter [uncultured Psychrobacter sp.]
MLGLTLLYVGAVLLINGLWLMGKIQDKEVPVINFLVGILSFLIAAYLGRVPNLKNTDKALF